MSNPEFNEHVQPPAGQAFRQDAIGTSAYITLDEINRFLGHMENGIQIGDSVMRNDENTEIEVSPNGRQIFLKGIVTLGEATYDANIIIDKPSKLKQLVRGESAKGRISKTLLQRPPSLEHKD